MRMTMPTGACPQHYRHVKYMHLPAYMYMSMELPNHLLRSTAPDNAIEASLPLSLLAG